MRRPAIAGLVICIAGSAALAWASPDQQGLRRGMLLGVAVGSIAGGSCIVLGAIGARVAGAVMNATAGGPVWGEGSWVMALGGAGLGLVLGGAAGWAAAPPLLETGFSNARADCCLPDSFRDYRWIGFGPDPVADRRLPVGAAGSCPRE